MALAEQGKLKLDAPIHKILDPWLQAQGEQSLLQIWDSNAKIMEVTAAHLLQMRSGIPDYDDSTLKARWRERGAAFTAFRPQRRRN